MKTEDTAEELTAASIIAHCRATGSELQEDVGVITLIDG